jgi:hypothetical protein
MAFRLSYIAFFLVALLCVVTPAAALDIKTAKEQGLVGEKLSGYIGAVSASPSSEVIKLVAEINKKRRAQYQSIAKKNGTKLLVVEELAAKKAFSKSPAGSYIQKPDGSWRKK